MASLLEHIIICQYLFAAFKDSIDEGLTPHQQEANQALAPSAAG
jgi:hypothetical protein